MYKQDPLNFLPTVYSFVKKHLLGIFASYFSYMWFLNFSF